MLKKNNYPGIPLADVMTVSEIPRPPHWFERPQVAVRDFLSRQAGQSVLKAYRRNDIDFSAIPAKSRAQLGVDIGRWRLLPKHYRLLQSFAEKHGVSNPHVILQGLLMYHSFRDRPPQEVRKLTEAVLSRISVSPLPESKKAIANREELSRSYAYFADLHAKAHRDAEFNGVLQEIFNRSKTGSAHPESLRSFAQSLERH